MRKMLIGVAIFVSGLAISNSALATQHACVFKPSLVSVSSSGGFYLEGTVGSSVIGAQYVCNIDANFNSITPETCKNWVAIGLTAQASGKILNLIFDDLNDPAKINCSAWISWTTPSIIFFGISN